MNNVVQNQKQISFSELFSPRLPKPSKKWFIHLDLDAYYASVEEILHPEYKGRPVIVGPDPKKSKRGVVLTANYEARKYGVRSAMPISKAYQLCPDAIFSFSGFEHYSKYSKQVMTILKNWDENLKQASIDEAYLDVTQLINKGKNPKTLCTEIQEAIYQETQLSSSLGCTPTKILSKIASDMKKPMGITILYLEDLPDKINHLPLNAIPGIGKKTYLRLQKQGLNYIADITNFPHTNWKTNSLASYVWRLAHGLQNPYRNRKHSHSKSTERTFGENISEREIIYETLQKLVKRLLARVNPFQTISIKVRLSNFKTYTRSRSFNKLITKNDFDLVYSTVIDLFKEFEDKNYEFRLLGVKVSNFKSQRKKQHSLKKFFDLIS